MSAGVVGSRIAIEARQHAAEDRHQGSPAAGRVVSGQAFDRRAWTDSKVPFTSASSRASRSASATVSSSFELLRTASSTCAASPGCRPARASEPASRLRLPRHRVRRPAAGSLPRRCRLRPWPAARQYAPASVRPRRPPRAPHGRALGRCRNEPARSRHLKLRFPGPSRNEPRGACSRTVASSSWPVRFRRWTRANVASATACAAASPAVPALRTRSCQQRPQRYRGAICVARAFLRLRQEQRRLWIVRVRR